MIDAIGRPQSVLVLGGSSEIARAIVAKLVPARCRTVVLAGREGERLAEAVREATAAGADVVESVAFDAADTDHHQAFADQVFDRFGDFDLVIAAAGILGDQAVDERDPAAAAAVMTTNYTGLASALLAVAGRLRHQGHGRLIVLSSVAAERAAESQLHLRVLQGGARRVLPGTGRCAGGVRGGGDPGAARIRGRTDDRGHVAGAVRHHPGVGGRRRCARHRIRRLGRACPSPAAVGDGHHAPSTAPGLAAHARLNGRGQARLSGAIRNSSFLRPTASKTTTASASSPGSEASTPFPRPICRARPGLLPPTPAIQHRSRAALGVVARWHRSHSAVASRPGRTR